MSAGESGGDKVERTEDEWRQQLGPERYRVLREKGTEAPFSGEYCDSKDEGVYRCGGCDFVLFRSDQKFDSGCGWPSFFDSAESDRIQRTEDITHGMRRVEITCARCGGHLGHVFPDGPQPTGERYCVNSLSVKFAPSDGSSQS